ncbi:Snf-9 [Aphelenchoides besseyi]|nr:Snf-9 [Aphelenchoides besseyi]
MNEPQLSKHDLRELRRPTWASKSQFLFTVTSYAVDEQGGGAFLIPYFLCSFLVGFPLLYFELSLGQFARTSPAIVYGRIRPVLQGVGWAMVLLSVLVCIYYNMVVAWSIIYLFTIIRGHANDWSSCMNSFNTIYCQSSIEDDRCTKELSEAANRTISAFFFNYTCHATSDQTAWQLRNWTLTKLAPVSPAEEFFENYVLERAPTLEGFGGVNIKLVIAYFIAWLITATSLCKGVKIIGRLSYITATVPYVIVLILFIRGITLPGSDIGMDFYLLKPDFSRVFDPACWRAAATHVSYSLSIGFGGIIALASYNRRDHNCYKGGTAVFTVLGFMAKQLNLPIDTVIQSGTGLAFIAYPEALSRMPLTSLWALLFFTMIWILGYGEIIIGGLKEQFPALLERKVTTTFAVCGFLYCCGFIMCTRNGIYYFNIFNDYASSFSLEVVVFMEVVSVCYIYGTQNYILDLRSMIGPARNKLSEIFGPTGHYVVFVWRFIAPLLSIVIFVFALMTQITNDLTYGKGNRLYVLPHWCIGMGWTITIVPLFAFPVFAAYNWIKFRNRGVIQPKWPSYNERVKPESSAAPSANTVIQTQEHDWSSRL